MGARRRRRVKRKRDAGGRAAGRTAAAHGLLDRKVLELFLERQFAAASRGSGLCIVVIGLHGMPAYARERGREAANRLRERLTLSLISTTRLMDACGRIEDDGYLIIIPGEASESGEIVAWRLCRVLGEELAAEGELVRVAAGVAAYEPGMTEPADLIARAEAARQVAARQPGGGSVQLAMPLSQGGRVAAAGDAPR